MNEPYSTSYKFIEEVIKIEKEGKENREKARQEIKKLESDLKTNILEKQLPKNETLKLQ